MSTLSPYALLDAPLVIELGSRVAVGAAGGLAAQLGAQVICIENVAPSHHGKWRRRAAATAGKQSVSIDRSLPADRNLLDALIARADVLLLSTDTDPGDASWWSPERTTRLIVCDITAFGHSGPRAGQPLSEALVGAPERPPVFFGPPLLEMAAAAYATAGIVAALRARRLRGMGQHIEVALYDVAVTALVNFLPLHLTGGAATRSGNRHALQAPWNVHRASDGWIVICGPSDVQWARMCEIMNRPELVTDARFATPSARLRHRDAADELIATWAAKQTVRDAEATLLGAGIPCGPIVTVDDLPAEPNIVHRASLRTVPDGVHADGARMPASPLRGDIARGIDAADIPRRNQHREALLELIRTRAPRDDRTLAPPQAVVGPCSGVRVIEVGQYTVAPLAGRMLGALGADVIKVEPPTGDSIRKTPPLRADGGSYIFALSNTDKTGVIVDLNRAEDRERLHELLATADALVENLKPGTLAHFGIDREVLRRRHPRLVYCSITGFGTDAAYRGRPALDTVIQAMSGLMDLTRDDGTPMKTGISVSDNLGGQFALIALLAGMEYRDRRGHGVHFDLSMQDTSVWLTHFAWDDEVDATRRPILVGATDGWVACEATESELRDALAQAGLRLEGRTVAATRDDLVRALQSLPVAPCLRLDEVFAAPQTVARGLIVERPTADASSWLVFAAPFRLSATPVVVRSAMAPLGHDYSKTYSKTDSI